MTPRASRLQEPNPNQGAFFGVETISHDGLTVSNLIEPTTPLLHNSAPTFETIYHVDTRERAVLLLSALGHMANAAMNRGMDRASRTEWRQVMEAQYALTELESRLEHAAHARTSQQKLAELDFLRVYNLGRPQPAGKDDVDFKDAFVLFRGLYGVGKDSDDTARRRTNRDAYIKLLSKIAKIPGPRLPYAIVEVDAAEADYLPAMSVIAALQPPEKVGAKPEPKGTQTARSEFEELKRRGLPLAPATYRELHELVDVISDPAQNAHNVLMDVRNKVAGDRPSSARTQMGDNAVASAIRRWDDYRVDARVSLGLVNELGKELSTLDRNTKIAGLSLCANSGMYVVAKHTIVQSYTVESSISDLGFDPLRAQSVAAHPEMIQGEDDHHGNQYTGAPTKGLQKWVEAFTANLTVGDVLDILPGIEQSEALRADIWTVALRQVAGAYRELAAQTKAVRAS